jgi:hypothetical protein
VVILGVWEKESNRPGCTGVDRCVLEIFEIILADDRVDI